MESARRDAAAKRDRTAAATRAYEAFVENIGVPAFRMLANVLRAEGVPFEVMTPSGGARLVSDRNREDAIELEFDTSLDPPHPLLVTTRTRGSRVLRNERLVSEGIPIESISEDDLIDLLLEEIKPWLG